MHSNLNTFYTKTTTIKYIQSRRTSFLFQKSHYYYYYYYNLLHKIFCPIETNAVDFWQNYILLFSIYQKFLRFLHTKYYSLEKGDVPKSVFRIAKFLWNIYNFYKIERMQQAENRSYISSTLLVSLTWKRKKMAINQLCRARGFF